MKRFFKYLLTVILITIFCGGMSFAAWAIINSFTTHADHDLIYGSITETANPVPIADKKKGLFKDRYVLNYVQSMTVTYNYNGKQYTNTRDFSVYKELSDTPTATDFNGTLYNTPYRKGNVIQIYVNKNNPDIFSLAGDADSREVSLKQVFTVAIPIYAVIVLIFTISYISRSRKERKQEFFENYMKNRY